jgi:hypothetical protein
LDHWIRDGIFAVQGGAVNVGDFTFGDFDGEITTPAVVTETVTTPEST